MFKKILGKTLDYFFGVGDDEYKEILEFYNRFTEGYEREVQMTSSKLNKIAKISIRVGCTAMESSVIYSSIKTGDCFPLLIIPLSEAFRLISLYFDKRNLKDIRLRKKQELSRLTHQTLDEIREEYDKRLEERLYQS